MVRHDRWVERLYWKAILLETILALTGYATLTYLLGRLDVVGLLGLAFAFPTLLLVYRARKSITFGKVLFVSFGAASGIFFGTLLLFLAAAGGFVPYEYQRESVVLVWALTGIPGAWLECDEGKKRQFRWPRI